MSRKRLTDIIVVAVVIIALGVAFYAAWMRKSTDPLPRPDFRKISHIWLIRLVNGKDIK